MGKCPPVPKKISEAAKKLSSGTKKERSEAGTVLQEHKERKH